MTITVTPEITLQDRELKFRYSKASGPGGQKVNKTATAVELRFQVSRSPSLPEEVKERLLSLAGRQVNEAGEIVIRARNYRTQAANREDAILRLVALIEKAAIKPRTRKKTRRSRKSIQRRLDEKKRRGRQKKSRRRPKINDDF